MAERQGGAVDGHANEDTRGVGQKGGWFLLGFLVWCFFWFGWTVRASGGAQC